MSKLLTSVAEKRLEIQQMTQAIALIENPPSADLPLDHSKLHTLARLERLLDQAKDKEDRQQRLELAKQALIESQQELQSLEAEVTQFEKVEQQAISELDEAIAEFNRLAAQQAALSSQIEKISRNSAQAISSLRGTPIYYFPQPAQIKTLGRFGSQVMFT